MALAFHYCACWQRQWALGIGRGTATQFARSEGAGDKLCCDEGLTGGGPLISLQSKRTMRLYAFLCVKGTPGEKERGWGKYKRDKEEGCDIGQNKCGGHVGEQRRWWF